MQHPIVRDYVAFIKSGGGEKTSSRVFNLAIIVLALVWPAYEVYRASTNYFPAGDNVPGLILSIIPILIVIGWQYILWERRKQLMALAQHAVPVWCQLVQANSMPVWVADLYIRRDSLKIRRLESSYLLCLVGTKTQEIELVPWQVVEMQRSQEKPLESVA